MSDDVRPGSRLRDASVVYRLCWGFCQMFIRTAFRVRWFDRERIPAGPVVFAANHRSYLDPILVPLGLHRPVHFMAKSELFRFAPFAWLLRAIHVISVNRGQADRHAIQTATERLKAGYSLGVFPEGTRVRAGKDVEEAYNGAAWLASRAGVPVVPVGISGTDRIRPAGTRLLRFPPLTVVFGEPVDPEAMPGERKERIAQATKVIMQRIEAAVEEAGSR